jgi:hypothetical protein
MERMSSANVSSILSGQHLIVFTAEIQARLALVRKGTRDVRMDALIKRNTSMR